MPQTGFPTVFADLRALYAAHEPDCVVLADTPGRYILGSQWVRPKDGYRVWFGGVEIGKAYVSAHLMPIYVCPEMVVPEGLRTRMQGKSCFNFTRPDPALFAELKALIEAGAARFRDLGYL